MLIFGVRHDEHLNRMSRLTVLTQEEHGIMGLEVAFEHPIAGNNSIFIGTNKTCMVLDRRHPPETLPESEMLFDISAGEELIALDVLQSNYVVCIKVYTNLGRIIELPPPDDDEWDMKTRAEDIGEIISINPGSGKVVGFFARAGSKGFQNLGLVHTKFPMGSDVHFKAEKAVL
ncbi:hypothetical protein Daus18300_011045 [Diaporthe australafricana]|uniref:Cleavage/polyadenylation specificity factor A subunit N-terminal domain-containing protein n=1 Tax=Diaporthe australafricana TaxID=127596 RepID=A0ABR3W7X3_9PEZI